MVCTITQGDHKEEKETGQNIMSASAIEGGHNEHHYTTVITYMTFETVRCAQMRPTQLSGQGMHIATNILRAFSVMLTIISVEFWQKLHK